MEIMKGTILEVEKSKKKSLEEKVTKVKLLMKVKVMMEKLTLSFPLLMKAWMEIVMSFLMT